MSAGIDRRWAQLAQELEFTRLPELRRQAEGWRTGLTGLTALLTVLALLKGRDNLAELPQWARLLATGLLVAAFLLLVMGSLLAMRAAHGGPEPEILLGGQALRRWTEREASRVTRSLAWASVCCVLGLLFAVASLAVAWTVTTVGSSSQLVRVTTTTGTVCGELLSADPRQVLVHGPANGAVVIPEATVLLMQPVGSCAPAP